VDLIVIGQGRFIPRIQRVAERTSMNIIVATGVCTDPRFRRGGRPGPA
jgi:phosphotriesterase-related protein